MTVLFNPLTILLLNPGCHVLLEISPVCHVTVVSQSVKGPTEVTSGERFVCNGRLFLLVAVNLR